jgi:hypothetical protein
MMTGGNTSMRAPYRLVRQPSGCRRVDQKARTRTSIASPSTRQMIQ